MTSGGNNVNDFRENQLTQFRAVYKLKETWREMMLSVRRFFTI